MSGPGRNAKRARTGMRRMLDAAVRVAERASKRVLFAGNELEHHILKNQIEEIQADDAIETTDEYDLITQRLNEMLKEKAEKKKLDVRLGHETMMADLFADETKKTNVFDCSICLSEKPLPRMRLLTPCGHVFCAACIANLKEANRTRDPDTDENGCPKCRGPMTSVVKPWF